MLHLASGKFFVVMESLKFSNQNEFILYANLLHKQISEMK